MQSSDKDHGGRPKVAPAKGGEDGAAAPGQKPEWAQSLRQLYDSVVDEPLPDTFKDLLDKLDKPK